MAGDYLGGSYFGSAGNRELNVAQHDGANQGAAFQARLPFAIIDGQKLREPSRLAARVAITAECR